ncbi:MAG: DUF3089 domain-containing protein [Pseudomonadota bacterium]
MALSRLNLIILGVGAFVIATVAAVIGFQDAIARFALKPGISFDASEPPAPPVYGDAAAWALWPEAAGSGDADIFYIHSTTYESSEGWNAPLNDPDANAALTFAATPNEVGPFQDVGAIYAPRYRQATLYAALSHKYDARAALELAYDDVETAFDYFLAQRSDGARPIILVGYGQGGLHLLGLLQKRVAKNERLLRHLAAAYIIDAPAPDMLFEGPQKSLPVCQSPQSVRCVMAFAALQSDLKKEAEKLRKAALVWDGAGRLRSVSSTPFVCVNPLSGAQTTTIAARDTHRGAASATGLRPLETPPAIANAVEAQCVDGILIHSEPKEKFLTQSGWFGGDWRVRDFNLFYHDIAADAAMRVATLAPILEEERNTLPPIEGAVDLGDSPVNKVND